MIIALYSYGQRAGKNTAATIMGNWCTTAGVPFRETSFAAKGKMLAALALGHSSADEEDWDEAIDVMDEFKLNGAWGWTVHHANEASIAQEDGREFIINLLEGARKLFGRDFWTDRMMEDMHEAYDGGLVVVTDLRRDWEADSIHYHRGQVVEIVNPRAVNAGTRVEEGIPPSCIDHRIFNTGTIEEYVVTVNSFMDNIIHLL